MKRKKEKEKRKEIEIDALSWIKSHVFAISNNAK